MKHAISGAATRMLLVAAIAAITAAPAAKASPRPFSQAAQVAVRAPAPGDGVLPDDYPPFLTEIARLAWSDADGRVPELVAEARRRSGEAAFREFLDRFGIAEGEDEDIHLEVGAQIDRLRRAEALRDFARQFDANPPERLRLVTQSEAPDQLAHALRHSPPEQFEEVLRAVLSKGPFGPQSQPDRDILEKTDTGQTPLTRASVRQKSRLLQSINAPGGALFFSDSESSGSSLRAFVERVLERRGQPHRAPFIRGLILADEGGSRSFGLVEEFPMIVAGATYPSRWKHDNEVNIALLLANVNPRMAAQAVRFIIHHYMWKGQRSMEIGLYGWIPQIVFADRQIGKQPQLDGKTSYYFPDFRFRPTEELDAEKERNRTSETRQLPFFGWTVWRVYRPNPVYDPDRYWLGPTWMASNKPVMDGFRDYGYEMIHLYLAQRTAATLQDGRAVEHWNPETGQVNTSNVNFPWAASGMAGSIWDELTEEQKREYLRRFQPSQPRVIGWLRPDLPMDDAETAKAA